MKKVLVLMNAYNYMCFIGKMITEIILLLKLKECLRFIWNDHGKYSKSSKFPITGFENNGTAGFAIYLELLLKTKGNL